MTNQWLTQSISYATNVFSNIMFVFLWFCSLYRWQTTKKKKIAASSFIERCPTTLQPVLAIVASCGSKKKNQPIFIQNNYCCQKWHASACTDYFPLLCGDICLRSVPSRLTGFGKALSNSLFLAWDAMFAVVITVFMGASHSALAFIYDSQKGHKRGERGWSLWLLLFAIAWPCLAHPLVRAGIPSLITGHPPCCRSNAAIKAVWESGAFVQLECSAINRLRTKVINCVTKEARAATEDGKERASARPATATSFERILSLAWFDHLESAWWLKAVLGIVLSLATGRRYWDQCHGRGSVRLPITTGKILSTGFGAQMVQTNMHPATQL